MAQSLVSVSGQPGTSGYHVISHPIPDSLEDGQVLVRFLAAPVNRVDLMVLAGQYPIKPKYTAPLADQHYPIPGFDGCAVVESSTSPLFTPGDLVLPRDLGLGTWRTHAVLSATAVLKLPEGRVDPIDAALIRSGALIARLLLDEAVSPPPRAGDYVIASAGTSCVAQFLVQLAQARGVRVILVVRDRPDEELAVVRERLCALGADRVVSESELERELASKTRVLLPQEPIVLALDSVFGTVGQLLAAALAPKGKFVLVGLLAGAKASMSLTTEHLFTRQLSFLPFRGSEVLKRMGDQRAQEIIDEITGMFVEGTLKRPGMKVVDWGKAGKGEVEEALESAVHAAEGDEVGHVKTVWKLT
ncbi:uncharacterized protein B0T15DRAFT_428110 [Chaetomium strumarium]|uniref:enoyl-[acyl-carrier-protein] reductase n=1 Tax=Chaetomium strumarium TaxID=1170767 RepID=A0AAJ0M3L2_9PEZI|nr:hypothetical protein B0T15DRAFT_428110 [Chaetomium strumarium]